MRISLLGRSADAEISLTSVHTLPELSTLRHTACYAAARFRRLLRWNRLEVAQLRAQTHWSTAGRRLAAAARGELRQPRSSSAASSSPAHTS